MRICEEKRGGKAMTGKWNYQPLTHQEKRVKDALAEHVGGNAVVAELLTRRGVARLTISSLRLFPSCMIHF